MAGVGFREMSKWRDFLEQTVIIGVKLVGNLSAKSKRGGLTTDMLILIAFKQMFRCNTGDGRNVLQLYLFVPG